MNDSDTSARVPETAASADTISPDALRDRIDRGEPVTILDVRISGDFEEWRIDGEAVDIENVPYYEFLDDEATAMERVPDGDPVVVVCAEGDASGYVADLLVDGGQHAVSLADGMAGWARLYDAQPIEAFDGQGTVFQYHRPSTGCLSYLVVSDGEAAVIDPLRAFADRYLADARAHDATLEYAIDTHCHADHVSGVGSLSEVGVTGLIPAATVDRGMEVSAALLELEDGDTVDVGALGIEARHTPGHTSGMTSYLVADQLLLTGDSLFAGSVARPDLEAGDDGAPEAARQLHASLTERILALEDETIIAGGHRAAAEQPAADGTYTARLGTLREEMDVLGMDESAFVEHILSNMPPRPANYETIIAANLGHREIDDEEAFRIELGPNNCAASHGETAD